MCYSITFNALERSLSQQLLNAAKEPATVSGCKTKSDKTRWAINRVAEAILFDAMETADRYEREFDPREGQAALRKRSLDHIQLELKPSIPCYSNGDPTSEALKHLDESSMMGVFGVHRTMFFEEDDEVERVDPTRPHLKMQYARQAIAQIKSNILPKKNMPHAYAILKTCYALCKHEGDIVARYPVAKERRHLLNHLQGDILVAMKTLEDRYGKDIHFSSSKIEEMLDPVFKAYELAESMRSEVREPRFPEVGAKVATFRDAYLAEVDKPTKHSIEDVKAQLKDPEGRVTTNDLFLPLDRLNGSRSADARSEIYSTYNRLVEKRLRIPHAEDCGTEIRHPEIMRAVLMMDEISHQGLDEGLKAHIKSAITQAVHASEDEMLKTLFPILHEINVARSKDFRKEVYDRYNERVGEPLLTDAMDQSTKVKKDVMIQALLDCIEKEIS